MCYDHSSIEKHKEEVSINQLIKRLIYLNLSSSLTLMTSLVELPFCGPCMLLDVLPLDGETHFLFIYLVKIWFLEKNLESWLIFVLFFKEKTK